MGLLLKCLNIKKEFGDRVILKDVSFHIEKGERVAIVGNNGAGKTTMVNIITGALDYDGGSLLWHEDNVKIGYLHQSSYYSQDEFENMIQGGKDEIKEFFHTSKELGIDKIDEWNEVRLENLSGGEKTKLAIARIWAEKPALLILDEPTNHMDYEGIQWLVGELEKYNGTIILISHDRYFMDKTVERIIEIEDGRAQCYKGNYSFYRDEKRRRYESQLHQYETQENYKDKIQRDIKQLKQWSEKAHRESKKKGLVENKKKEYFRAKAKKKDNQVKSKLKRLEKIDLEGIKKPKDEQKITFNFVRGEKSSNRIFEAKEIRKGFGDKVLFENSSFYIRKGEKIGLFGKNGCGKTTLIKAILKELYVDKGDLYLSPSAKVAYLSQDVMNLDGDKTVLQTFGIENYERRGMLQTLLTNMGFSKSMIHKKVSTLSLGERTRVKVAYMIMMENNVLILDEPTNHLDLHSREMLEKTLEEYEGTIILVSHDRYLLERLCDKILIFEDKAIKRCEYSFKEYMDMKEGNVENGEEKSKEEQLMILENRIAAVLSELSLLSPGVEAYEKLDEEFKTLIKRKREFSG
ncbi:ribosomal protection-like ABC-F family protein [Oceanirhabdus sp. W0125-5]|uniref:ribosomal protection-like ABC-F family protein n=1 Tax=Oceanirhabdus sp. W0125-5 TaxID=2999116 RepID=UPI0022F31F6A|nr:ABC-F type ribosomal protection protein [Oceanirhabdus sp. W0125-5]WBW97058.1 ABC-F type ribosomal protection protein [Oceanirhabdus sp. W0125-5]